MKEIEEMSRGDLILENKKLIELLRYFYNLPSSGVGDHNRHKEMLNRAEQALGDKP